MAVLAGFHCDVVGCQLARRRVRCGQRQQQSPARVHEGRCDVGWSCVVGWARQLEDGGAAVAESVIHQWSRPRGCVCVCVCVCVSAVLLF